MEDRIFAFGACDTSITRAIGCVTWRRVWARDGFPWVLQVYVLVWYYLEVRLRQWEIMSSKARHLEMFGAPLHPLKMLKHFCFVFPLLFQFSLRRIAVALSCCTRRGLLLHARALKLPACLKATNTDPYLVLYDIMYTVFVFQPAQQVQAVISGKRGSP